MTLGNGKSSINDNEGAIAAFNKAIELNKNDFEVYFDRGSFYTSVNKFENAVEDLSIAIKLNRIIINPTVTGAYH